MNTTHFYYTLGRPFSPLYSLAMRLREAGYRRGIFKSYQMDVPVISVGNLTMGGSGKTPMVQYLARLLQSQGFRPAIISRGYGGRAKGKINLVSDGSTLFLDAQLAGDEPRMLAETLPGVSVLTGIVRRLPAQQAVDMGADVLLLDDGFQHLPIRRDINLVLFHTDRLAGNSRVFPGGDLREPVVALHRASHFVLTGTRPDNQERADRFADLLRVKFPRISVYCTGYEFDCLVELASSGMIRPVATEPIASARYFGFCGIAHPESFRQSLAGQRGEIAGFLALDDHQRYTTTRVEKLMSEAKRVGATCLLTTEKDLVKLATLARCSPLPLYALRMRVAADKQFGCEMLAGIRCLL
jgi:tetraacyldisaccharide 4'-kinase